MHHLVERRSDQAAQPDQVRVDRPGPFEDFLAWNHHAHIDHFVVIAGENNSDDVLPNVMNIAFDGGEYDFSLRFDRFAGRSPSFLLGFHVRSQDRHSLLHDARRLHHLRQKHLACTEEITHDTHASHQWPLDPPKRATQLDAGFLGIGFDIRVDSLHQRVRQTVLDRTTAPLFGFLFVRGFACTLQRFPKLYQPFGSVGTPVQQDIFDELLQGWINLFVHFEHPGIHDAHIHTGSDGVVEERRVDGLANDVVAAKTKGNVGDTAAYSRERQVGFDPARGIDVVDRVIVVLLHARGNGQDIWIEDDVFRREADLINQNPVGALADTNLFRISCRLTLFVESHHDDSSAIFQDGRRMLAERLFPFFQRNRIYDAFALQAFQACLDDFPFRGVNHGRHFGDFRLTGHHLQEARHGGGAVNHALVHTDVEHIGAVFDLLTGHADGLFILAVFDELGELRRTGHVGPFADHDVNALLLGEWLRTGQTKRLPLRRFGSRAVGRAHTRLAISPGRAKNS